MRFPLGNASDHLESRAADWLPPKGGVAELLRVRDWSGHALGEPRVWPAAMRALVSVALNLPQPVFLFWGPAYLAFYNDAARALLGGRDRDRAGEPAAEALPGLWPSIAGAVTCAATSGNSVAASFFSAGGSVPGACWSFSASRVLVEGPDRVVWCQGMAESDRLPADQRPASEGHAALLPGFIPGQSASKPTSGEEAQGYLFWAESMPVSIYTTRPDGSLEYINSVFSHYSGEPAQSAPDGGWGHLMHPEDLPAFLERWSRCLITGETCEAEVRVRRNDGVYRWFLARMLPMRDAQGRVVRWFGTNIDVDDLKKTQQALARAEHEYRILTESAPQFIWRTRPDGTVEFVNRVWREYTGLASEQGEAWASITHPDDLSHVLDAWAKHSGDGTPYEIEYRVRRAATGEYRWFLARVTPYRDENGRIVVWLGFAIDVHERKGAEAELTAARAAAETANNTKDQFLATLSHELRTPLNAILGWTQLIKMTLPESEQRGTLQEGLDVIERNTLAQVQLVEDLLDVSRIVSGQMRLERIEVNLTEVIKTAVESVRPYAQSGSVQLREELAPGFLVVAGDGVRLQQVIWNLLTNAIKFSEPNGTVWVRTWREEASAAIEVVDQGRGIPPESLARLFEPFFQVDRFKALSQRGLGLGLAIVHSLVQLHGGTVKAFSEGIGRGSTFQVQLPLLAQSRPDLGPVTRQQEVMLDQLAARQALQGLHLLIVDDEPDGREVLGSVLRHCGAEVTTVASGQEALAAASVIVPDVLICDIYMPGMDGYTTLESMRAVGREQGASFPAIALTAFARADDRMRALQAGFQRHLAKPVAYAELVRNILELAGKSGDADR